MENNLSELAKLIRYHILTATTAAGSGHPTSSLSAADIMAGLMFGGFFKADLDNPENPHNDRLIFSKGHASPLFYALYAAAGKITAEEMLSLRKFGSRLEGHPTLAFPYTELPTGSLGQGLSEGLGMAINGKYLDKLPYRTYVLLGDSETAEGSVWEAAQLAAYYKLDNLVGILDVNRLGQSRETIAGHNVLSYEEKFRAFGWETAVIDGHNFAEIRSALAFACESKDKPTMIIAKTVKGKGVSFIEDKEGWHGKALSADELTKALKEIGEADKSLLGMIAKPETAQTPGAESRQPNKPQIRITDYEKPTATRKAYGNALVNAFGAFPDMVVLDGETSNSTFAETFRKAHPDKYFEMFIAEQNMIGTAAGLARRGKIPFVSTFAAFFSRAYDQIRMAQYGNLNIKLCGSHAGVSIGEDGASQMGLEDLAMFRTLIGSAVLYPSDAVSAEKLVALAAEHQGLVYIRTTRKDTAVLYSSKNQEAGSKANSLKEEGSERVEHDFKIGGSCTLRSSEHDQVTVIGAGVTLHEALAAYEDLKKEGISIRVVDLYSIKPIDAETIKKAAIETKAIITVEDHHHEGGLGEAVLYGLSELARVQARVHILAVKKEPKSGKPDELLAYEEINKDAIIKKVKEVI